MWKRLPWQEELRIIDDTMKAISGISDPEKLVETYWNGIGKLISINDYVSVTRRDVEAPFYLVSRSSRFTEHLNPWTQRDRLPRMSGGLLGEIAYGSGPLIIEDLPARLSPDDPAYFYLQGFQRLVALPQYDNNEGVNATALLFPADVEIDHEMIPMLHLQSGLFGRGTQNLVLRNQLASAMATLDRELQSVGEIQRSLLPDSLPSISGFSVAAFYETSARAGGDYYDFFPLENGEWGLFIADVSGHGTPAAVVMAITHAIAHAKPRAHTPPGALLRFLNDRLANAYTRGGTFVTAFYAVLNPGTRRMTYARAGHNSPRLVRGNQVQSLDGKGGLPMGIIEGECYEQAEITLEHGDLLLLYTDGIVEAMAPLRGAKRRNLYGVERLDTLLLEVATNDAEECVARIRSELTAFSENAPPSDDQTVIAIRCL